MDIARLLCLKNGLTVESSIGSYVKRLAWVADELSPVIIYKTYSNQKY